MNETNETATAVSTDTVPQRLTEGATSDATVQRAPVVTDMQGAGPAAVPVIPELGAFIWDKDETPGSQTKALCTRLAATKAFYRTDMGQIFHVSPDGDKPRQIRCPVNFEGAIRSSFDVEVVKDGDVVGHSVSTTDLNVLLSTPALQKQIPAIDLIVETPTYDAQWNLTRPGYNSGEQGGRIYYVGKAVTPKRSLERIREFLGALPFKSEADRTNAVAYGLTVLLRHMWPGKKPFFAVTANRSHAGKDTVVDFGAGRTRHEEISWHCKDWATQNEAVAVLSDSTVGVLSIGNIRSGTGVIESAFIERIVTSPKAIMQSSKMRGPGFEREGDFVVCATANCGKFSPDLANRSVPIHLELIGSLEARKCPIGNPRHEYLPRYREEIEAEFCGMIEAWKALGRPLDDKVRHPMSEWAAVIGGILQANGFTSFLQNWSQQRNVNDTIRESLAIVADNAPHDQNLRVNWILTVADTQGVLASLIEPAYRGSSKSKERRLGVILSNHAGDTVSLEDDDGFRSYTIVKSRTTVDKEGGKGKTQATVYSFKTEAAESKGA